MRRRNYDDDNDHVRKMHDAMIVLGRLEQDESALGEITMKHLRFVWEAMERPWWNIEDARKSQ